MKRLADKIASILVLPIVALYRLRIALRPARRDLSFQSGGQLLSLIPGDIGVVLRRAYYRQTLAECAESVYIAFGALFSNPGAKIAADVYVGANCMIGLATIGEGSLLGSNVDIPSGKQQHNFDDATAPIRSQGGTFTRVTIGRDVWLGNGCIVLADVGDHAVVAAGAVVVNTVEAGAVVGGNPARVLRRRNGSEGEPEDGRQRISG